MDVMDTMDDVGPGFGRDDRLGDAQWLWTAHEDGVGAMLERAMDMENPPIAVAQEVCVAMSVAVHGVAAVDRVDTALVIEATLRCIVETDGMVLLTFKAPPNLLRGLGAVFAPLWAGVDGILDILERKNCVRLVEAYLTVVFRAYAADAGGRCG